MSEYLGKDIKPKNRMLQLHMATAIHLTSKIGYGHKLYMDNFFSSPRLFDDLTKNKKENCYPVRSKRKGTPGSIDFKVPILKRRDRARTRCELTAIIWKEKSEVYTLTNMHNPPAEGNFCNEHGNAMKPSIVEGKD
jgi:hypothetical protein